LRHLHQGKHAFLHPGAARRDKDDDRKALARREIKQPRDLLADHDSHAPTHELEVHDAERDGLVFDLRRAYHDRVVAAARLARLRHPLRIRARVDEPERVSDRELFVHLAPGSAVNRNREPLADGQAEMMGTLGAYVEIALDFLAK